MEQTRQLANAPLILAIAAIRFESLEALPNWIPAIQERVRRALPSYRRVHQSMSSAGLEVAIEPPDFDPGKTGSSWLFSTADLRTVVTLHKGGIILHTVEYTIFPEFSNFLRIALDALLESADVLNVNQIGMRYVDHIQPKHGMDLQRFIVQSLMPKEVASNLVVKNASTSATYISTDSTPSTVLKIKFSMGEGESVVPHDLAVAYAMASSDYSAGENLYRPLLLGSGEGVLDMDAGSEGLGRISMGVSEILKHVDRLHRVANDYFDSVITADARRAWSTPQ